MQRDPRAYLWDVREATQAIQTFVAGIDATTYALTPLVHSAVERKFEIIGEALGQLARLDAALASRVPGLSQIVAFRNQLIHGYAVVNHNTVWNVVQESLPLLLACVQSLLQELGEDE
jgi:uncharacterized protein with HEPN domain